MASRIERLERLVELREMGAITDDEFNAEKARLIGAHQDNGAPNRETEVPAPKSEQVRVYSVPVREVPISDAAKIKEKLFSEQPTIEADTGHFDVLEHASSDEQDSKYQVSSQRCADSFAEDNGISNIFGRIFQNIERLSCSGGCMLVVLIMTMFGAAILAIQYIGSLIGVCLVIAAYRMKINDYYSNKSLKINLLVFAGIAISVVQGLIIYSKYKNGPSDARLMEAGPIPRRFQGVWASDISSCSDYYSRMIIDGKQIKFSSGNFSVNAVYQPDQVTAIMKGSSATAAAGDILLQNDTVKAMISPDGKSIAIGEYKSVRCPKHYSEES